MGAVNKNVPTPEKGRQTVRKEGKYALNEIPQMNTK